jgi:hypothetical protein
MDGMEPRITINGVLLTEAQAATVSLALGHLWRHIERKGLGDDEQGQRLSALMSAHLESLANLIRLSEDPF